MVVHEKASDKSKIGKVKWHSYPKILKNNFIPVYHTAALNKRYYGKLQGRKNKKLKKNMDPNDLLPGAGILSQAHLKGKVSKLSMSVLCPISSKKFSSVREEKNVIICAHQGSLRALVKYIENISDEDIRGIRFSTGELATYRFSEGRLVKENIEIALKTKINL
jgi:2,3-bisphosphoglycerate-dependent phosphoglycerate mutase